MVHPRRLSPTVRINRSVLITLRVAGTIRALSAARQCRTFTSIFMTGLDGTPMPSFADTIQPNDAWDLVHFLRTLQVHRHSKENDVLKAAGGTIPPYVEKTAERRSARIRHGGGGN